MINFDGAMALLALVKSGQISSREFRKKARGYKVRVAGRSVNSKYTLADRAQFKSPVKNPKIAAHVNAMHVKIHGEQAA